MVQRFHSQIEINSSPEEVRKTFLDFESMPKWHQGFTVRRLSPNKPAIEVGDKLKLLVDGTTLIPTVMESSGRAFQWRGSYYGLVIGLHTFRFEPSVITPGATTFVQDEEFTGVLSILFYEGSAMRKKTQANFETFNNDLKTWVEGQSLE